MGTVVLKVNIAIVFLSYYELKTNFFLAIVDQINVRSPHDIFGRDDHILLRFLNLYFIKGIFCTIGLLKYLQVILKMSSMVLDTTNR